MKLVITVWLIAAAFIAVLSKSLINDYKLYVAESTCVRGYIAKGIERKNIITKQGTCFKENELEINGR